MEWNAAGHWTSPPALSLVGSLVVTSIGRSIAPSLSLSLSVSVLVLLGLHVGMLPATNLSLDNRQQVLYYLCSLRVKSIVSLSLSISLTSSQIAISGQHFSGRVLVVALMQPRPQGTLSVVEFSELPRAGRNKDRRLSYILMRTTSDATEASLAVDYCKEFSSRSEELCQTSHPDILDNRDCRTLFFGRVCGHCEVELDEFRIFQGLISSRYETSHSLFTERFTHPLKGGDKRKIGPFDCLRSVRSMWREIITHHQT